MALPLLRVAGLTKSFPGLKALDDVSLEVHSGEIVAIVGHNGSGKSTLVKVLAEVHQPDPGAVIEVRDGRGEILTGPQGRNELHFIHQDLGLIDMMNTVENLDLARAESVRDWLPTRGAPERHRARSLIARFGADFDVTVPVGGLSAAERAIVAVARALDGWDRPDKILILDEPTTALHGDEVETLFAALRRIADAGAGIVFISHRLDEVLGLADRVVALRDGQVVADEPASQLDHDAIVRLIAGRAVAEMKIEHDQPPGEVVLEVANVSGGPIDDVSFTVHAGEILGISGILGSGRDRLCPLLFGAQRRVRGRVAVAGHDLDAGDMAAAIDHGLAFVPADRSRSGAVMDWSARENLTLPRLRTLRRALWRLDGRAERSEASHWATSVQLSPPDPQRALKLFSGGNQQKLALAKWLRTEPRVLLLDEPTQGVDVGAKVAIYELIQSAARAGAGVVVCSSDTKELVLLCDRVIALDRGRVTDEVPRAQLNEARLVRAELGLSSHRPTSLPSPQEVQVG